MTAKRNYTPEQTAKNTARAKAFNLANIIYIKVNLNRQKDADIIRHLSHLKISKASYIKRLIRQDIMRYNEEENNGS